VDGRLVLDYALDVTRIVITTEVQQETVHAGLAGGYPDAVEIKTRIDAGSIEVRATERLPIPFEEVLDLYGLQAGDKAVVRLALQAADIDATVTDDRLLFVVLRRCGRETLFLPDFVERAVADSALDAAAGQKLLLACRSRLPAGFVEHSLRRLEGVIYMAISVQTILDDHVAKYVNRMKEQRHATDAAVVRELVESGYDEVLRRLHARYARGELTFRAVAADLGLSVRELYELFELKGLPT
jgi:hypothetical protein